MTTPKQLIQRLNRVISAWEALRPDKTFGGMTLAQFRDMVKGSFDIRTTRDALKGQVADSLARRRQMDASSNGALLLVVNAVKGDPAEGEDGPLYAAMGYKRKSERRSGLTRKVNSAPPPTGTAS